MAIEIDDVLKTLEEIKLACEKLKTQVDTLQRNDNDKPMVREAAIKTRDLMQPIEKVFWDLVDSD